MTDSLLVRMKDSGNLSKQLMVLKIQPFECSLQKFRHVENKGRMSSEVIEITLQLPLGVQKNLRKEEEEGMA